MKRIACDNIIVIYIKYLPYYGHYSEELRKDSHRFIGRWKVSLLVIKDSQRDDVQTLICSFAASFIFSFNMWRMIERERDIPSAFAFCTHSCSSVPFHLLIFSIPYSVLLSLFTFNRTPDFSYWCTGKTHFVCSLYLYALVSFISSKWCSTT